ncbi:lipase [Microdochium bolleyi]|uniref:Lipase n=1 Tax=Microdochium bolleyi TaxID=196109 RepID=A0A136J837_9PEZI|nr:lipase [Microdochium bolleyi]
MKISALLSAPLLVAAAPATVRTGSDRLVAKDSVGVTSAELADMKIYSQWAGAANCNGQSAAGAAITCTGGVCPDVEATGARIVDTFGLHPISGVITDIHGFVATDDKNKLIVVSYKGSTSLRNYLADIVFYQVNCDDIVSGCTIHAGFATANNETWKKMTTALKAAVAANPSYKIIFTGHSLGGATATVAAAKARNLGYAIDLFTYGSPRVGNEDFAQFVTNQPGRNYRVTHLTDPVPRLPPIFLGFRHVSPEYWLQGGAANTTDYGASDIKVCEGTAKIGCNAGSNGLEFDAHNYYLGPITGCTGPFTFRRRDVAELAELADLEGVPAMHVTPDMSTIDSPAVTDEQLLARMKMFAAQDIVVAQSL